MTEEPETCVCDQVGKRPASNGCSDFHIRHHWMTVSFPPGHRHTLPPLALMHLTVKCISSRALNFVVDHVGHSYNKKGTIYVSQRRIFISNLMLDLQILFSASSYRIADRAMTIRRCHQSSQSCYPDRQSVDHFNMSICQLDC